MTVADFFTSITPSKGAAASVLAGKSGHAAADAGKGSSQQGKDFAAILEQVSQAQQENQALAASNRSAAEQASNAIPQTLSNNSPETVPGSLVSGLKGDGSDVMAPGLMAAQQMASSDQAQMQISMVIDKMNSKGQSTGLDQPTGPIIASQANPSASNLNSKAASPAVVLTPAGAAELKEFISTLPVEASTSERVAAIQTWVGENTGAVVNKPSAAIASGTNTASIANTSAAEANNAKLNALVTGIEKAELKVAAIKTDQAMAAQKLPEAMMADPASPQASMVGAAQQSTQQSGKNTAGNQGNNVSVNRAALASANGQSAAQSSAANGLSKSPAFEAGTLPFMAAETRPAPQAPGFVPPGLQAWVDSSALASGDSLESTVFSSAQGLAPNSAQTMQSAKTLTPQQAAMARQLADQVGVSINKAVDNGVSEFTIRLNPAEMGNVTVKLQFGDTGLLRATVMADSRETLDLLQRDARGLERALGEGSKGAPSIDFSLDDPGGESAGKAFAEALHEDNMKDNMALKDGSEHGDFARKSNPSGASDEEISLEAILASVTTETGIDVNV